MRFLSLDALAFGPFTDTSIDLSDTGPGLHVIYGRNESGKSSALRALKQFLYGIPNPSADDFVHPYNSMRIAATIMRSDGTRLRLVRRKGNKNTLRDADDKDPVDDSLLPEILSGIDQQQFELMFGLDHDMLIRGGQDLLSGGNDLGQIIFSAGASISGVTKVLATLDEEAKDLFKPSGQNPSINAALKKVADLRSQLRSSQLSQTEWSKHDKALADALKAKDKCTREYSEAQTGLHRLRRIRDAHVSVSRRSVNLQSLEALGSVVSLPPDFAPRATDLLTKQQNATTGYAQAQEKIAQLDTQLADIHLPLDVLAHAESIDALYKELGVHTKAAEDRLKRETKLLVCETEARSILKALGKDVSLEEAEKLPITSQQRALLQEMMLDAGAVLNNNRTAREHRTRFEKELALRQRDLSDLPAERQSAPLKSELVRLQKLGPLDDRLDEVSGQLAHLASRIENGKAQLLLPNLEDRQLSTLPVPMTETIEMFREQLGDASRKIDDLKQRLQDIRAGRDKAQQKIDKLELEMDVPTEAVLEETRQHREGGWRLIKRWWLEGDRDHQRVSSFAGEPASQEGLALAYEQSVACSDETGDRLRREAHRVEQKASLLAQRSDIDRQIHDLEEELAKANVASEEIRGRWSELWAPVGVDARTPKEMISWRNGFNLLTQLLDDAQAKGIQKDGLLRLIEQAKTDIVAAVKAAGEDSLDETRQLAYLLEFGGQALGRLSEIEKSRQTLNRDIERLKGDLDQQRDNLSRAEAALSEWSQSWKRAVAALGISESSTTAEAQAVLAKLEELSAILSERADLIHRIAGIKRDSDDYWQRVESLMAIVAPDTPVAGVGLAVDDMRAKLKQAQASQSQHAGVVQRRDEQTELAEFHQKALTDATNALAVMCAEAGCQAPEHLLPLAKKSEEVRKFKQQISQLDEQLAPLCGELSLSGFVKAVEAADHDSLQSDIDRLTATIAELHEELEGVNQTIGSEKVELGRMNGAAGAAVIAEQIESVCAQIREDSEQYTRLKLAEVLLRKAVERYREKNQSPVLQRASEIFAGLTCGSFAALRADVDDQDAAVLLGIRGGVTGEVGLAGMSEGTRDQLYLALRLASVEHILKGHEPIPFIVDDILVTFDDQRAAAALTALAELSRTTQVIFFTHHAHLVDLARNTLPASNLFLRDLDSHPLAPKRELIAG